MKIDNTKITLKPISTENRVRNEQLQTFQVWSFISAVFQFLVVCVVKMWSDRNKKVAKKILCTMITWHYLRRHFSHHHVLSPVFMLGIRHPRKKERKNMSAAPLGSNIYSKKKRLIFVQSIFRPTLWIMKTNLRAGPTNLPFWSWYLTGTKHFCMTILVRRKWTTQPCWIMKPVPHNLVRMVRFWIINFRNRFLICVLHDT